MKLFYAHQLNYFTPSWDGKYVAYGISASGSEETTLYVLDTETLEHIDQPISRVLYDLYGFSLPDSRSFLYNRQQEMKDGMATTEKYQKSKAYLHKLGTDVAGDRVLLGYGITPLVQSPVETPFVAALPNSDYALALIFSGTQNEFDVYATSLVSLTSDEVNWKKVCDDSDRVINIDVHHNDAYLLTRKNSPNCKIVKVSLENPDFSEAETVLEESHLILKNLVSAQDAVYVQATDGSNGKIIRIPHDGRAEKLAFPLDGVALHLEKNDPRAEGVLLSASSWTKYDCTYAYNPQNKQFSEVILQPKGEYDSPSDLVSQEVEVRSHDGVMVPLSIIHRKGIKLNGSNPCWLVGYGAYGASLEPYYEHRNYAWFEQGGVAAFAHVRGGGEKGEAWYRDGWQQKKPNTWKDFIACAEYLIAQKYTSSKKLGGKGQSAGGILIGRAITERPDLFAVAIPRVGCMNAVHMETTANGVPNIPEFGSCQTQKGFQALYEMDAFLHLEDGIGYPAMLITHGMNDSRVEPWQSAKFAARAQAASISNRPTLLRIDYEAGHGAGLTKTQIFQERADIFAFMMWQFGMKG